MNLLISSQNDCLGGSWQRHLAYANECQIKYSAKLNIAPSRNQQHEK